MLAAGKALVVECRNNEEGEVEHEADDRRPLVAICLGSKFKRREGRTLQRTQLVVDEQRCQIVTDKGNADTEGVVLPSGQDALVLRCEYTDELTLGVFVAVKKTSWKTRFQE